MTGFEALVAIIAIISGCMVPISIVGGAYYYKLQKDKLRLGGRIPPEDKKFLTEVKTEVKRLNARMENLEYIVTNIDENLLPPGTSDATESTRKQLEQMTKRLDEQS